ncbi:MAG TPA: acyltransferase [Lysobacter sp.]|nr:acyltransferase [Lysobacter sp.]
MNDDWKQRREGGGRFAIRLIRGIGRYGGRGVARACLVPITVYFLLRRSAERRDSLAYLARIFGRRATWWDAARHIHCFASTILDRVFLLGGELDRFEVTIAGVDHLHASLDRGRGALLLGSHLGSFEVLRVLARERSDYVIRVVLDKGHNPAMTQLLDELNPQIAAGVIDAGQDGPSLMLQIQQAVQSGALVALLADRVHGRERGADADFLGDPARFPLAPMQVAAALKVPVVLGFGLYRGGNRYDLVFEAFSDGLDIPRPRRNAEIAALIRRYAERLEHHARSAPFNWFNFYDFWFHPDADSEAGVRAAARGHGRDRVGVGGHA